MVTWTDNIPAASHTLAQDQPLMENNYTYVEESYGKDHNFSKTSNVSLLNNDGYHTVIHQQNSPGNTDPTNIATTGQTYVKTIVFGGNTDQALFFESGGGRITQLTNVITPSATNPGWTSLPGGIIMIYGSFTNSGGTSTPVTFPAIGISGAALGFPTNCFGVLVSANSNTALTSGVTFTANVTGLTGFTFLYTGTSTTKKFFYTAYGN